MSETKVRNPPVQMSSDAEACGIAATQYMLNPMGFCTDCGKRVMCHIGATRMRGHKCEVVQFNCDVCGCYCNAVYVGLLIDNDSKHELTPTGVYDADIITSPK
jgi:hypothetical protein